MGNTNDTTRNYRSENNKEEEKGFFDTFICCGQAQQKEINANTETLRPEFIWFYESDLTEKNSEIDKIIWIPYTIELNQLIEKSFNSNKKGLQINFAEDKKKPFQ